MNELTSRERFKQNLQDGGDQVVVEYFRRLAGEGVSIDDLRKAVELVAKSHGLNQSEKQDSLMQVSWTITGGNVTIGMSQAPQDDVIDAESTTLPEITAASPPDEPAAISTLSLNMVDNMLEGI